MRDLEREREREYFAWSSRCRLLLHQVKQVKKRRTKCRCVSKQAALKLWAFVTRWSIKWGFRGPWTTSLHFAFDSTFQTTSAEGFWFLAERSCLYLPAIWWMWHSLSSAPKLATLCFTRVYTLVEGGQTWECDAMINMDFFFVSTMIYTDIIYTTNQLGCSLSSNSDHQVENSWPIGGLDQSYNHNHSVIKWAINRWVIAYYVHRGTTRTQSCWDYKPLHKLISIMNCRKGLDSSVSCTSCRMYGPGHLVLVGLLQNTHFLRQMCNRSKMIPVGSLVLKPQGVHSEQGMTKLPGEKCLTVFPLFFFLRSPVFIHCWCKLKVFKVKWCQVKCIALVSTTLPPIIVV